MLNIKPIPHIPDFLRVVRIVEVRGEGNDGDVPTIPPGGGGTIPPEYGVSIVGNENFPGEEINKEIWDVTGTATVLGGECTLAGSSTNTIRSKDTFTIETGKICKIEARVKRTGDGSDNFRVGFFKVGSIVSYRAAFYDLAADDDEYTPNTSNAGGSSAGATTIKAENVYYKLKIIATPTYVQFYIDDILIDTRTARIPTGINMNVVLSTTDNGSMIIDWVKWSKY